MPAQAGQRDRPRLRDPAPSAPRGPPPSVDEGRHTIQHPPPSRLTHQQPGRPRPALRAAKQPRPSTRGEHAAGHEQGPGAGATGHPPAAAKGPGRGTGGGWRGTTVRPPSSSPPHFAPSGPQDTGDGPRGGQPSTSPKTRGGTPPTPQRAARPGGRDATKPVRHTPPRRHQPALTVTTTGRRTRPSTQGRPADQSRGQHTNTNHSSMEATRSKN